MSSKEIRMKPGRELLQRLGIQFMQLEEIRYSERRNVLRVFCVLPTYLAISELERLHQDLQITFGNNVKIEFSSKLLDENIPKEELKNIVDLAIQRLRKTEPRFKSFLCNYRIFIEGNDIYLEVNTDCGIEIIEDGHGSQKLEAVLYEYGLKCYSIHIERGDFTAENLHRERERKEEIRQIEKKAIQEQNEIAAKAAAKVPTIPEKTDFPKRGNGGFSRNKTREIKGSPIPMKDFAEIMEEDTCIVEGEIFSLEDRELSTGNILKTLWITDESNSLTAKLFLKKDEVLEIAKNDYVRIEGKVQIDTYAQNEKIIMIQAINRLERKKTKKEDLAEEKMVELHTHTKMSEMVGVTEVGDIIKRAKQYGHSAVAITDYGVVHSFPGAHKAAKEAGIKAILGCEAYMIDDTLPIVHNLKEDQDLEKASFVVYDLETLGFNSHEGKIIEIGAVKIVEKRIVDRFSQLVNPGQSIPQNIVDVTNITDSMVQNEPNIEEVLPKFLDFIEGSILVAHNADFDIGYLKQQCKQQGYSDFNPSFIDTLQMAKDLYPELKQFGLGPLNKKLGLSLENHHRAVDDCQATGNMFLIFLDKYLDQGIHKLSEMQGAFPVNTKKQNTRNVMLLVKDRVGLENLNRLVSDAHLYHFGNRKPRVLKSNLEKYREGLIVGCSLTGHSINDSDLFHDYSTGNVERIPKKISFYDYIELLPRQAYTENIEYNGTGLISGNSYIEKMNQYFYDLAKEKGILVTGSSNVHYLDPEEAKIRTILLYGSGMVHGAKAYKTDNGFYFRTTGELLEEFSYLGEEAAKEILIQNTNAIAEKIEVIKPIPDGFYPPSIDNAEETVREMTYEKAYRIYGNPLPEIVEKRLERELNAIIGNGFSVLYLSAQKLVKKSLDNGYLVGSRGSVGSSLVAFMMGITEVNALYPHYICTNPDCKHVEFIEREGVGIDLPEKKCPKCGQMYKRDGYSIPFEVFMGFNGDKVPDIDLNFSGEYQSEIHRYCEELFGKENVFKAGTISTLAEKNAAGYVKKYFEDNGMSISQAEVMRLAKKCEGAKKTTGQHPGGMVVVPSDHTIFEFCPVQKPANDENSDSITTHYDYHVMDEQLVKLDILGHDDPTTIKLLQEYTGLDIYEIPLSDPDTLKIFSSTESLGVTPQQIGSEVATFGIPEFGTPFVRQMLLDTRPTTFAELVRISGLSHGTDVWLNNAQDFIRQKQATLSEVITVRDDIMNYLIDQGIEKGTAFKIMEFVRKGKPSKDPEGWKKYSDLMKEKHVKDWYIESCRRIKYMFPKGHAVAYVMMAIRIAYFKVHYPLAFYAAYLSRKAEDFNFETLGTPEKARIRLEELSKEGKLDVKKKAEQALCEVMIEMEARHIELLPIDLYHSSGKKFLIQGDKIRVPLIALAGLGGAVIDNILEERQKESFISIEDFKKRTKVSQTIVEKMKDLKIIENMNETNQISLF